MLGSGGEWSDKYISLYNLDVFLHSGCLSTWVPNCPSLKNETTVQRADMERWEVGGECSYAAVGALRGTASGSRRLFQRILLPKGNQRLDFHLNAVKLGAVVTWYPRSWSLATQVCQGWIQSHISNNSGGKAWLLQGSGSEKVPWNHDGQCCGVWKPGAFAGLGIHNPDLRP